MDTMTPQEVVDIRDVLEEARGAGVYVWSYTISHRQMTLRIQRASERRNVHLVCSGCSFFHGVPTWANAQLRFTAETAPGRGTFYILRDDGAEFELHLTHATVERDVLPLHVY